MEATGSAERFLAALETGASFLSRSRKLIVAVSGGRDSVALLHGLLEVGFGNLIVVHLNHRLRGTASTADERFVRSLASKRNLPVITGRADVRSYAKERGLSIEHAAREMRHVFLASCCAKTRCRSVVLAHHANDQVETCLFNYLRGSGPAGLAGMARESVQQVGRRTFTIIRPMLGIPRPLIDGYIAERRIRFREDATNAELDATRNKLRHLVLPAIREAMGGRAETSVLRTAEIFREEDAWADSLAREVPLGPRLSTRLLKSLPVALQRRVLRRWLLAEGVAEPGFETVEVVRSLLAPDAKTAKVNLPGSRHVRRRAGVLFLE